MPRMGFAFFGKPGNPLIQEEVTRYQQRLRSSLELEVVELRESKQTDIRLHLDEEAAQFEKRFPVGTAQRVVLAEEGRTFDTVGLAQWLQPRLGKPMVFLVGSAYGIAPQIKQSADLLLSLSSLTFTHDHVRILLAEQIYRCMMVLKGHPYHHV